MTGGADGGVYTLARGKHVGHDDTVSAECVRVWVIDDQAAFRRATAAALAAMSGALVVNIGTLTASSSACAPE